LLCRYSASLNIVFDARSLFACEEYPRRIATAFGLYNTLLERIDNEGGQTSLLVSFEPIADGNFSLTPEVTRVFSELKVTVEF